MWCQDQAGYPACSDFVLVSNGTVHGYSTGGSGATGVEAQRTLDLQPGDSVLFSWEPWTWGPGGVPTCVGEWEGYPAGDHVGLFHSWVDQGAGRFRAVEGNTSDGSWDNGGMVLLREDRWTSQVCGWWRQERLVDGTGPGPAPGPGAKDEDMYSTCLVTTEGSPWKGSVFLCAGGFAVGMSDGNIVANLQARGLAGPTIEVQEWDITGAYQLAWPMGPGAVPR